MLINTSKDEYALAPPEDLRNAPQNPTHEKMMARKNEIPPSAGMTLVELLVVIAILGIAAGVTGLQFLRYAPTYELRSNARSLYAEMQNAKTRAIRAGRSWGIVCNEGASECTVYSSAGADGNFTNIADNVEFKSMDMKTSKHGIRIGHGAATSAVGGGAIGADNVTYDANTLVFLFNGVSNPGTIYLQNDRDEAYAVGTNMFGNIFIRRWDGGGWN